MKSIVTYLISLILLCTLCGSAWAGIVLGLSPEQTLSQSSSSSLASLERSLSRSYGEDVTIRRFSDETSVSNWLLRFQELDGAIVSSSFLKSQPAGSLRSVAELHISGRSKNGPVIVTSYLFDQQKGQQISRAFIALNQDPGLLKALGLAGVTRPGERLKVVQKPTTPPPAVQKPAAVVEQPSPPKPKMAAPAPEAVIQAAPEPAKTVIEPVPPVAEKLPETSQKEDAEEAKSKAAVSKSEPIIEETKAPEKSTPSSEAVSSLPVEPTTKQREPKDLRLTFFIVLLFLLLILCKIALLVWKHNQKKGPLSSSSPIQVDEKSDLQALLDRHDTADHDKPLTTAQEYDPEPETAPAPVTVEDVLEEDEPLEAFECGELGPGKVPSLLMRCANQPEPVILKVQTDQDEKQIHFAAGQVSGGFTQAGGGSVDRWTKLGYLLVRENLVSEAERDQGLEQIEQQPELRLGEVLIRLGYLNLAGLRHALTRQAKVTIYSLILYPEGRYQILTDDNSLPAEESVSLEISGLIREASHHKAEWTAIRKALPRLGTVLDFTDQGRDKLAQVRLSIHQQLTLSKIDGHRTISGLCSESTMLDYEVYRFLYLMVKAGVLHIAR